MTNPGARLRSINAWLLPAILLALAVVSGTPAHSQEAPLTEGEVTSDELPADTMPEDDATAVEVEAGAPEPDSDPLPAPEDDPIIQRIQAAYDSPAAVTEDAEAPPPVQSPLLYDVLRNLAILSLICGLIIMGGYIVRRAGRNTPLLAGPSLGTTLGRIHLSPKHALHFVRVGDRVLVVGVTQTSMSLITEVDAATFDAPASVPAPATKRSFMEQLQAANQSFDRGRGVDEDIDSLRGDIKRLQQYLQESARE